MIDLKKWMTKVTEWFASGFNITILSIGSPPNGAQYGSMLRFRGNGMPSASGTMDTYWIGIDSGGQFYHGIQVNQASTITWFKHADWVIEQGTSGIWRYRKWNSGISECWGEHSATISHYTTVFGGYGYNTSVNFPTGLFATYPKVTYSARVGNGFALTGTLTNALSANSVSLYAVSSASGSQSTSWQIHAIGQWT